MRFIEAKEVEKEVKVCFMNDEGEQDDYNLIFRYDGDSKKWISHLSGEFEEDELEIVKKISKEINDKCKPVILVFDKEKAK